MVVDVQPGYARNYLVRSGLAVYMGEGPWRKVLPEVSKAGTHDALKLTPRAIGEEIRQLLMTTPEVGRECTHALNVYLRVLATLIAPRHRPHSADRGSIYCQARHTCVDGTNAGCCSLRAPRLMKLEHIVFVHSLHTCILFTRVFFFL